MDMNVDWNIWTTVFIACYMSRHIFELVLDLLQYRHLKMSNEKQETVSYNIDRLKFGLCERLSNVVLTCFMILVGFRLVDGFVAEIGFGSLTSGLIFFGILMVFTFLWGLPLKFMSTFCVEDKHGFNNQTYSEFAKEKIKKALVTAIIVVIILSVALLLIDHGGVYWWLYAFVGVLSIQLLVAWVYPILIMPLFNKFTPVKDDLADDVNELARKVSFPLSAVVEMDGSKQSKHSNAFFVGLRGARRIVLYDTLIDQVSRPGLLAVLAHEFGHFKLKHVRRRLVMATVTLFCFFAMVAYLQNLTDLYVGFGFESAASYAILMVCAMIICAVMSPFRWISNILSRRDEYAADKFAVDVIGNSKDLGDALSIIFGENSSINDDHWLYRSYYHSHPSLEQRIDAMNQGVVCG